MRVLIEKLRQGPGAGAERERARARAQPLRLRAVRSRQPPDRRPRGGALRVARARRDRARAVSSRRYQRDRGRSRSSAARTASRTRTPPARSTSPRLPFPAPGSYVVAAVAKLNGRLVATSLDAGDGRRDSDVPGRGRPRDPGPHADRSRPSAATSSKIETRVPPDTMHEVDLADALDRHRPVVLLFATPALCESRVCGPVTDVAEQVKSEFDDEADFIHMEIYNDNDLKKGAAPAVRARGICARSRCCSRSTATGASWTGIQGAFCGRRAARGGAQGDPLSALRARESSLAVAAVRRARARARLAASDPGSRATGRAFSASGRRARRAARRAAARAAVRAAGAAAVPRPRRGASSCCERVARAEYPRARAADRRRGAEAARPAAAVDRPRRRRSTRSTRSRCSGFYDDRSKRLVVIREPGATRPLLEITLAHELVHALEDQRFGLDSGEGVPRRRGARRGGARRGHGDGADGRLRGPRT